MKTILCYGDSNTWGLIPGTHERYPWNTRWTGVLQEMLSGKDIRIIEEGLCGRTTVFEDSYRENRNGLKTLPLIMETHSPVDAVIIMLGTNDCKECFDLNAHSVAEGMEKCIDELLKFVSADKILLVSPIHLGENIWESDPEFNEKSLLTSSELKREYRELAKRKKLNFLAASDYAVPSLTDREHMTEQGHKDFAEAVFSSFANTL
ncbi:MAG: GDSL-type esterase/lipase family protein [Clostridia bacterium]|nr:GDSL-type esterase/lipase family protein [Clostridia bacterium]